MNKAARYVTGDFNFAPTRMLLAKCNWLSVRQLVFYQTVIMTHKTMLTESPIYLWEKFNTEYSYQTRQHISDTTLN